MKREQGLLLQRWAKQELRLHCVARGLKLVQWRERGGRWSSLPGDFDGILGPTAEAELRKALNNRAAFAMLDSQDAKSGGTK